MRLPYRLLWISICLVATLLCALVAAYVFVFRQYRDVLVLEAEGGGHIFEFWVDLDVFEEGDPALIMKVRDRGQEDYTAKVFMGFVSDWYADESVDVAVVQVGDLQAVVLGGDRARPLLIWDHESDRFAPSGPGSGPDRVWLSNALDHISEEVGAAACLGQLSSRGVECRVEVPEPSR